MQRNPILQEDRAAGPSFSDANKGRFSRAEKLFQTKQYEPKPRCCIYCDGSDHKSVDCKKVQEVDRRREIIRQKRLCFNYTGSNHRAANPAKSCSLQDLRQ